MARPRSNNLKKSRLNKQCRDVLSAHIKSELGIMVEPDQVRLKTEDTNDPYVWERVKEKDYLFSKNISEHSTGTLVELRDGVKIFFAAVMKSSRRKPVNGSMQANGRNYLLHTKKFSANFSNSPWISQRMRLASLRRFKSSKRAKKSWLQIIGDVKSR